MIQLFKINDTIMEKIKTLDKVQDQKKEQKEKYGENIEVVIDLIRHAEKSSFEGGLTEIGEKNSEDWGQKIKEEFSDSAGVKVYHSGQERAERTAMLIEEGSKTKYKKRQRNSLVLSGDKISKERYGELINYVNKDTGDESEAIQAMIDTGNKRPDEKSYSSRELSRDIAEQIYIIAKMTKRLKNNSKVNFVLASHSGMIEHFLVDALKKEREDFVNKIGGQVKFLEGVRIFVNREDKENVKIKVKFRDHDIDISKEELQDLCK